MIVIKDCCIINADSKIDWMVYSNVKAGKIIVKDGEITPTKCCSDVKIALKPIENEMRGYVVSSLPVGSSGILGLTWVVDGDINPSAITELVNIDLPLEITINSKNVNGTILVGYVDGIMNMRFINQSTNTVINIPMMSKTGLVIASEASNTLPKSYPFKKLTRDSAINMDGTCTIPTGILAATVTSI